MRRIAGVTVPLFSLRSASSWGIGEILDLPELAGWLREAGIRLLQLLPLCEMPGGETSPYSALTAFALDPIYISIDALEDLDQEAAREAIGGDAGVIELDWARARAGVDYEAVRALKGRALRAASVRFREAHVKAASPRARELEAFQQRNAHWLEDFALFRALKDRHGGVAWWDWPAPLAGRREDTLEAARAELRDEVLHHEYLQWIAHSQWDAARARFRELGVEIMGDLPFVVARDSADVWAHQDEFRDDASVGAPPDQFDKDGQEWGLPPYRWDAMLRNDFAWLRARARHAGALFDRFRIDHLVGFYRTYTRPKDRLRDERGKLVEGAFDPPDEPSQLAHGERVIGAMIEAAREVGGRIVAEDLGVIPDFVRPSLARLGVPGYKVLIWEKDDLVWRDPRAYPDLSVATFGTHDTAPVAVWWESLEPPEREVVKLLPALSERASELGDRFTPEVHRALLDLLLGSASELVLLLIQEVLGTRDRINVPATVGPHNWTYRLPGTVHELRRVPAIASVLASLRDAVAGSGR